jgi:hypothetical protein
LLTGERCGAELAQRAANVVEFAQKPTPLALQSVVLGLERVALDDEGGELIICGRNSAGSRESVRPRQI